MVGADKGCSQIAEIIWWILSRAITDAHFKIQTFYVDSDTDRSF